MTTARRFETLDVFRGLTVLAMIVVSTPGTWEAVYSPLDHAAWNGWTPTDLVFPFFLFAMGAAVPVALARRRGAQTRVRRHVLRRGAILFALGLVLNAIETAPPLSWSTFRIPGVLQRIAIVYVLIAWLTERTSRRAQAIVAVALLIGYWAAMTLVPVPGVGAGVLTPEGNLAAYLDRVVLGRHLVFGAWDSEGLLSTLPAVATALAGVFAGDWLMREPSRTHRALSLWAIGAAATVVALVWDRAFPINKNLWTSSFALLSAGVAAQVLVACHWLLGAQRWRAWSLPLTAFGRNALVVYFLSIGLDSVLSRWTVNAGGDSLKAEMYTRAIAWWTEPWGGAETASLVYALAYTGVWGVIAWNMYRRRVFVGI